MREAQLSRPPPWSASSDVQDDIHMPCGQGTQLTTRAGKSRIGEESSNHVAATCLWVLEKATSVQAFEQD
ncbi:uncharacterized protein MYCFIDRAFT_177226 [Pseudocercospora fijiensis CIRAD86]|uniref:Uncharacterized protein n=1 Tax=Pseudocercospora fijiensis (strain CIRAD86) TaxID=383855 RepID=M2YRE8_PSEFD|nr:uncharacterized protein MYCFIDRAFT_177226 [Pseudocercospora fijiensis CIRAD86]EME80265.1 hypothetical protein MYCFIDRAFT_177226 [Pseudocercospora fijiensis CIRAD86]